MVSTVRRRVHAEEAFGVSGGAAIPDEMTMGRSGVLTPDRLRDISHKPWFFAVHIEVRLASSV